MTAATDGFVPRALLMRRMLTVELTPSELYLLVTALNEKACRVAEDPELIDAADYLLRRAAELREAGR